MNHILNQTIKIVFDRSDSIFREFHYNKFEKCGDETIQLINSMNPQLVLDLGCGDNQYKEHIKNLVGIDIVNTKADILSDISSLSYEDNSVDACLCYGSINFGDDKLIEIQLKEMNRVLKSGGISVFRGNTHISDMIPYYIWTEEKIKYWTNYFNFTLQVEPIIIRRLKRDGKSINNKWRDRASEQAGVKPRSIERLYWIWRKN
jgi:ubiquinone/menaquinone biosynthesis C-methylase UbiE